MAQLGTIKGNVSDKITGELLFGVTVMLDGTATGTNTDFDGNFSIKVKAGTYKVNVSSFSHEPLFVENVTVSAGGTNDLGKIQLSSSSQQLDAVVIKVKKLVNTEAAVLEMKKDAVNVTEVISQETFKKIGDTDAASSMKRVSGVSVSGGKYVYVRGLGDRYNKTMLNGLEIPGLDPDRNSIQMDIFPTNLIDNIMVHKSFTPELPADFTGGIIDIATKSIPETKKGNISLSTSYNPNFHFNNDYLTYTGSKTDFLGYDDGTRAIPATTNIPFFSDALGSEKDKTRYQDILSRFNPELAAFKEKSFMDYSVGGDYGTMYKMKKFSIGYIVALSYKNTTEFYKDAEFNRFGLASDPSVNELEKRFTQKGNYGVNNVLISAMGGIVLKVKNSSYKINALQLQNGESKAGIFDFFSTNQGAEFFGFQHNLEYSERSIRNFLLEGHHAKSDSSKWNINWKLSPTFSKINDPDIRFTRYEDRGTYFNISTESGFPVRIWREMNETDFAGTLDFIRNFTFKGEKAKIKFGAASTYKQRDFIIRNFNLNIRDLEVTGDPNELFTEANLWPVNGNINQGTTYEAVFLPVNPNQFDANNIYAAAYASSELNWTKKLKTIIGLRTEKFVQRYTGRDQVGLNILNNDIVLDDLDLFPSVNFVYSLKEKQNFRFSYSKTIARPSFKELSFAEIFDPITGRTFIGGLFRDANDIAGIEYWDGDLKSTDIHNLDLRWEIFQKDAQTISISAFYKKFLNPIEIVQFATQAGAFQPRNVGDGQIIGAEIDLRQQLTFISKKLSNLTFNVNFTYTDSRIEMSKTEYDSRVENARDGQEIKKYRQMAGQAPFLINAGFAYNGGEKGFWNGFETGIYYNVQGSTLQYVGIVDRPDVYASPFHSLNLNSSKTFGKDKRMKVGLKISNLLNDQKESVFQSFNAKDQYFTLLDQGITGSLNFSYKF